MLQRQLAAHLSCNLMCLWYAAYGREFPVPLHDDGVPQGCSEHFILQPLDHFNPSARQHALRQRYLLCGDKASTKSTDGRIFLYTGNEAPVDLYARYMGQLWDLSDRFGALLVFAEHRFFGKSNFVASGVTNETSMLDMGSNRSMMMYQHLTPQQAVLDFAKLIEDLQSTRSSKSRGAVAFGGSYGGVLAVMLRRQRPDIVVGAVASSAPLALWQSWFNPEWMARAETHATVRLGGRQCANRFHRAVAVAWQMGHGSSDDKEILRNSLRLCKEVETAEMPTLLQRIRDAITSLAMASSPQESSYFVGGKGKLPAYPLREACVKLGAAATTPLDGLRDALMVYYNASGSLSCFDLEAPVNGATGSLYGFLRCGSLHYPDVGSDGKHDMFWPQPYNASVDHEICLKQWGLVPKPVCCKDEIARLKNVTNVALSFGELDPWKAAAPKPTELPPKVAWRLIKMAGHHIDLMAGGPGDTDDIREARSWMSDQVAGWLGLESSQTHHEQVADSGRQQTSKSLRRVHLQARG